MAQIDLRLHERQGQALLSPATEILYGGAAGGGKSHLLRCVAIHYALNVPGVQVYLFRKTYPELMRNHMEGPSSFHVLLSSLVNAGKARIVQKEIRFWNGSKIFLNSLQYLKSMYQFQGQEIHVLLFDELTHFQEEQYRYLRGRCRVANLDVPEKFKARLPLVISGSNPGGIGHTWVKRTFVNAGEFKLHRAEKEEGGMLRQFIPAKLKDNPTLAESDPDYLSRLQGLGDPLLVRAMAEGDWSIVAGSMFGDAWRPSRHILRPFPIPMDWKIWRGMDDGYSAPASIHWFTQDPEIKTYYCIDEFYKTKQLPEHIAAATKRHDLMIRLINDEGEITRNSMPLSGYLDGAAFADTGVQNAIPRGDSMNALGCRWKPVVKWPGSRVDRVRHLHRMLAPNPHDPAGMPHLRFFDTCINAIETIPTLPRDIRDPEDVDTDADDHAFDSVTYGLMWKLQRAGRVKMGGT